MIKKEGVRIKLAMITPRFVNDVRGGGETSCQLLVHALRKQGVEVDVLAGDELFPEIKDTWKLNIAMYRYLKEITNDYDIFHTYNMSLLPAVGLLTKKYGVNSVASLNGHVFSPTFARQLSNHPTKEYLINSFFTKTLFHHIKRFTVLSEFYKDTWVGDGISHYKIRVIPNMIPEDYALTDKLIHPKGTVTILAVGNYAKWRNIKMLLDAYSKLPRQNIILNIVGQGWEKEVMGYKGKNTLIYYPHVEDDALKRMYSLADIYIQSYNYYGIGRAMLEAAQSKTAILTTGRRKDFSYLHNDIHYFDDARTLEWELQMLIADKKHRQSMSKNVSKLTKIFFNPEIIAKEYMEVYENVK